MKTPIVVNDNFERASCGDLSFYETLEEAERAYEVLDLEGSMIHAFDAEGRILDVRGSADKVVFSERKDEPKHPETLRGLIVEFFQLIGDRQEDWQTASLPRLLERGLSKYRSPS